MLVLTILTVILLLAFLIEALTEYFFGALCQHIPALTPYSWLLMYVAALVGVIAAALYRFDLIALLSAFLQTTPAIPITPFGMILTGMAIGRGSNFLHDLFKRFFRPQAELMTGFVEPAREG